MRVMKKIYFLSILIAAIFFAQNASAVSLPSSSYLNGAWEGYSTYNEPGFLAYVQYAVYDSQGGNEISSIDGYTKPGQGRFIYVYEIFQNNDSAGGYNDIASFGIQDIGGKAISESLMGGSTALNDGGAGGIAPTPIASEKQGIWIWQKSGAGYISTGEHSWFLMFSSNSAPVAGKYQIKAPENVTPTPGPEAPEPVTAALLGLGSIVLFIRRRKSA